jgi:hypothetical protein
MWEAFVGTAETQIPPLGLKSSVGMTIRAESRLAGRNKKAHCPSTSLRAGFQRCEGLIHEPSASGTAQQRRQNGILRRGLGFLLHATHRSTTPTRATPARFGGPGATVGYHLSRPRRSCRTAVGCWSRISPKPQKAEPRRGGVAVSPGRSRRRRVGRFYEPRAGFSRRHKKNVCRPYGARTLMKRVPRASALG